MVIEIFKSIVLGIVEGLTEFLPISSTGHLILVNEFFSFSESFTKMFDIVIQFGSIIAVIWFFRKRLFFSKGDKDRDKKVELWKKSFIGVAPALVVGFIAADFIDKYLFSPYIVAITLIIGGVIIFFVDKGSDQQAKIMSVGEMSYKTAFIVGLLQCLAMIPGTSRAGATIIGAMALGVSRVAAAEYSFFLAIPTIFAASGYSLLKAGIHMSAYEGVILAVGFITAFVTALLVIKKLMRYIQRNNFRVFGYYRIALGAVVLIYLLTR